MNAIESIGFCSAQFLHGDTDKRTEEGSGGGQELSAHRGAT